MANRYVVGHVDYLIAYVWHIASNVQEPMEFYHNIDKKT